MFFRKSKGAYQDRNSAPEVATPLRRRLAHATTGVAHHQSGWRLGHRIEKSMRLRQPSPTVPTSEHYVDQTRRDGTDDVGRAVGKRGEPRVSRGHGIVA